MGEGWGLRLEIHWVWRRTMPASDSKRKKKETKDMLPRRGWDKKIKQDQIQMIDTITKKSKSIRVQDGEKKKK